MVVVFIQANVQFKIMNAVIVQNERINCPAEEKNSTTENCHDYRKARRLRMKEMRFATPQLAT